MKISKRFLSELGLFSERKLYYPVLLRDLSMSKYANRKEKQYSNSIGITDFGDSHFFKNKKDNSNKVFFLLGGSTSINDLKTDHWRHIYENTSLGINSWFVHEFEPNFLMTEGYHEEDLDSKMYTWTATNLKEYLQFSRSIPLFKNINTSFLPWAYLAGVSKNTAFSISRLEVPGRTLEGKKKATRVIKKMGLHQKFFLSSRASVVLGMSVGYRLGFKKIVLCGFDLREGKYFWEQDDFKRNRRVEIPPGWAKNQILHPTANPKVNKITADIAVTTLVNDLFRPLGIDIYVSSKRSRLHPYLPVYKFPDSAIMT